MPSRRPALTLAVAASLAGGGLTPALAAAPTTEVRVGLAGDFTRIEFRGAQPIAVRKEGQAVVLRFGAIAPPDLSRLRVSPPRFLAGAERVSTPTGVEVRLTLAEGATATLGRADGAAFVNLGQDPDSPAAAPAAEGVDPVKPAGLARPAGGESVRVKAELQGRALRLSFPWRTPVGAAVFRRGEAVWVVFDAPGRLDLSEAPRGLPQLTRAEAVGGARVAAVRLVAPTGVGVSAVAEGGTWVVSLGAGVGGGAEPIDVRRDPSSGALEATLAGGSGVVWLADTAVGDRLAVVPALGPAKGVARGKAFVEAALLATAHGLAIAPTADDLLVTASGDRVRIGRPHGLALSSQGAAASAPLAETGAVALDLPAAAALPGLIAFDDWSRTGRGGFLARYDALRAAAAAEGAEGQGAPMAARFGLARFLVGSELAYEAIGVLGMIAKADPKLVDTPEFRGLRGAAHAIAGRLKQAEADVSSPVLAADPAAGLWRGYVLSRRQDWAGARAAFAAGRPALAAFTPKWRARFLRAEAEAAVATGDLEAARTALALAPGSSVDALDVQGLTLAQARLAEASGHPEQALPLYASVAESGYGGLAAPAGLKATQLKLASGAMPLADALRVLDSLRYRWRGDAVELEVVGAMGRLYLGQGRYREALEVLRSAGRRLPDLPAANAVQAQLADAFKLLFLDGAADGLQPIQALALFDDFRELAPIGADGDRMVRRLAKRLVDVDLLDNAAALLKYQVENRLDGAPKAEVSADLAAIYLMARKPEQALGVIEASRSTLLPTTLNAERRRLEARALVALGRFDHALELIDSDGSSEAQEVKAEIAWGRRSWAQAGAALEASLGDRWKTAGQPLAPSDEDRLLRAGIAYSLAQDDRALARLRGRWGGLAQAGRAPDALRVALTGAGGPALNSADLSRAAAETDAFAGWVSRAKARFLAKGA